MVSHAARLNSKCLLFYTHPALLIEAELYDFCLSLPMFVSKECVYAYIRVLMLAFCVQECVLRVCVFTVLFMCVCVCVRVHRVYLDVAALSAMSGTASSRVAGRENDDDEIKILRPAEGAAAISLAAVRIDLFQHLTFNHDKTVGKLIVLQDIRHQSPLILSGAPRRMNTNRLSRQSSHPLLPSLFLLSFFFLILFLF